MTCGSVWNWGASKNCNFQCEDNDKPIQLRVLRRGALSMFWLETQTIDSTIDKPTPQTTKKIQQIAWKSRPSWSKKTSLSHHMLSCLIHLLPCRQFETAINLTSIPVPALNLDVKCRDHCSQQVARPCTTTAIKSIHPDTLQVDKRQSSTHWKHPRKMRLYSASSSSAAFFIRGRQSEHFFISGRRNKPFNHAASVYHTQALYRQVSGVVPVLWVAWVHFGLASIFICIGKKGLFPWQKSGCIFLPQFTGLV